MYPRMDYQEPNIALDESVALAIADNTRTP